MKLRRDITRLLLVSYILLIFSPAMPVLADKVAHTFWEQEHLIAVHKIYGANHLHVEMEKAGRQADKEKSAGSSKSGSEEYLHILPGSLFTFSNGRFVKRTYLSFKVSYPVSCPDIDVPPPRA